LDPDDRDPVLGIKFLSEAYLRTDPSYDGRVTVPAIVDTVTGQVVTNDYPQITLDLSTEWTDFRRAGAPELIPADSTTRAEMDQLIDEIYRDVNNGVYRCGFATSQEAYEAAYDVLFARLDVLEDRLKDRTYLLGDTFREVDVRLFTTLVRFDAVYHGHFKCNRQKLTEFPNLWAYARRLYQLPGFGETVDFDQIKRHYYVTHDNINPTRIVPKGPDPRVWTA
ncbi:MAG: glutathione S-transferase family protein, partial [Kribbellaceae bacterium]|nr:glutathione S-transferase family protein [Kribbellaceae bacterium]